MKLKFLGILPLFAISTLLTTTTTYSQVADKTISMISQSPCIYTETEEITSYNNLNIVLNGTLSGTEIDYIVHNNTTFLPIRVLSEMIGANIDWNNDHRVVVLEKDDVRLEIPIDYSKIVRITDEETRMYSIDEKNPDVGAFLYNDTTFLPANFITKHFSYSMDFQPGVIYFEPSLEVFALEPIKEEIRIDMTFMGDFLLATDQGRSNETNSFHYYQTYKEPSYYTEKVIDYFNNDDFTLVNLENVLTDKNLSRRSKTGTGFWFKSATNTTDILTEGSVELVSVENNHWNDYGAEGKQDTINALADAGLTYGYNDKVIYVEKDGFKIGIICHGLWSEGEANTIISKLETVKENSDYQILFYHGGTEAIHTPEEWKKRACRKIADAGMDLIVGAHPHVLQPMETYNGVDIIYSLGNFVFGANYRPENATVIMKHEIVVDLYSNEVSNETSFIPCYVYTGDINSWQPAPMTDETAKQKVLDFMYQKRSHPIY